MRTPSEKRRLPAPFYGMAKKVRESGKHPMRIEWESYFIPGTDVMRNKLGSSEKSYGITDPYQLEREELVLTASRRQELFAEPIVGKFDLNHMSQIHQHLFQDVYHWAGQPRGVGMNKAGHTYAEPEEIRHQWKQISKDMTAQNHLKGITDQNQFSQQLAETWNRVNYAHTFREGNTRSQMVFFHQLCQEAGWQLDTSRFSPVREDSLRDEFIEARFSYQAVRNTFGETDASSSKLAGVLNQALSPSPQKQIAISKERHAAAQQRLQTRTADLSEPQNSTAFEKE